MPDGEQWKLYGLAATVLLNAGLAAVPIDATVAYGNLSQAAVLVSAALGFLTIGITDALVVGQWYNYAKHFTKIDPDAPIPPMPGTRAPLRRARPRLLVTAGLVFTLGLLLTLAMNRQAVRQEMGTLDSQHNSANRTSLLAPRQHHDRHRDGPNREGLRHPHHGPDASAMDRIVASSTAASGCGRPRRHCQSGPQIQPA